MPELPARSIADIHLSELFEQDECPLCTQVARSGATYVNSFLYEGVTDVGFRRELDRARGFCRRHTREVLAANRRQSGGTLGSAILFEAILRIRGPELDAALESRGNTRRKRVADASRPPACPVCGVEASAVTSAIDSFHGLASGTEWREAIARGPFCLDHLLALLVHRPTGEAWDEIERAQGARVRDLRARLGRFAAASSHDRRHRISHEEQRAADDAAALLGGDSRDPGG
jgi:hypothetical protein